MAYELTGKVKLIQDTQTFDSGFRKREMVVTVEDGKYPQDISLEFVQDKINLLENLGVGEEVTVTFDIRGREYKGRYFNNLQGWKIASAAATAPGDFDGHAPTFSDGGPADAFQDDGDIPF